LLLHVTLLLLHVTLLLLHVTLLLLHFKLLSLHLLAKRPNHAHQRLLFFFPSPDARRRFRQLNARRPYGGGGRRRSGGSILTSCHGICVHVVLLYQVAGRQPARLLRLLWRCAISAPAPADSADVRRQHVDGRRHPTLVQAWLSRNGVLFQDSSSAQNVCRRRKTLSAGAPGERLVEQTLAERLQNAHERHDGEKQRQDGNELRRLVFEIPCLHVEHEGCHRKAERDAVPSAGRSRRGRDELLPRPRQLHARVEGRKRAFRSSVSARDPCFLLRRLVLEDAAKNPDVEQRGVRLRTGEQLQ